MGKVTGGASWTKATFLPFEPSTTSLVRTTFAPGRRDARYLVVRSFGLARSDDAGRMFQRTFSERLGAIAVDPGNPDMLYLAAFDNNHGIFKSLNGGLTVTPVFTTGNFSTSPSIRGIPRSCTRAIARAAYCVRWTVARPGWCRAASTSATVESSRSTRSATRRRQRRDDRVQAAVAGTIWLPDAGRHVLMDLGLGECPVVDPQLIKLALEVLAPSSFRDEDPVRPG